MTGFPEGLSPMLAVPGALPADDANWAYEVKFDGVRVLAYVDRGAVRLISRRDNEVTAAYPELQPLAAQVKSAQVVLDGEVAVFDESGRTDFSLIQSRMHVRHPSSALVTGTPVKMLIFDVLHLGRPTLGWPYERRREALLDLGLSGPSWSTPPAINGDGPTVLQESKAQGLEGIVAKRRNSRYQVGRRSPDWLKIKNIRRTSAVIVGWTPGEGSRAGQIGSLLLAVNGHKGLEYAGHVGTGFSQAMLAQLQGLLKPLTTQQSPLDTLVPKADAKAATWVRPQLVAEIDYTEWTRDGRLRHPAFKGLRDDYDPRMVTRE